MKKICSVAIMAAVFLCGNGDLIVAQEPIIRRDLAITRGLEIVDFDAQAIHLSDGQQLGWGEVLAAKVAPQRQSKFDTNLVRLGLPLFRLKYRVSLKDWAGAGELAEPMYRDLNLAGSTPGVDFGTEYLICVATMKSRLKLGERAAAVLPFLKAAKIQQANSSDDPTLNLLPSADVVTMFSSELLPIWFNHANVEAAFAQLANSFVPTSATQEVGAIVYLASMAIEVRRFDLAKELIVLIEGKGAVWKPWRVVLQAELDIAMGNPQLAASLIETEEASLAGAAAAVCTYLKSAELTSSPESKSSTHSSGAVQGSANTASAAMLALLKIPAFSSAEYPELAAAAMYRAAIIAAGNGWHDEGEILRRELMLRFPFSYHAQLIADENGAK